VRKVTGYEKRKEYLLTAGGLIVGVIFLFPLYWMIVTAFKTEMEIFQSPPTLFPNTIYIEAIKNQFTSDYNILGAFKNSTIIAITAMIISTCLAIPASYGLARFNFKGKRLFVFLFLMTQMLPATLVLTPLFITFKSIGLLNTHWAPILADATIGIPFSVLILRTYFVSIPKELEEAAKIDGCSQFSAFFRIMLPIAVPGVVVAAVFSFMFAWGDLIYGLTFIGKPDQRPITAGIYNALQQYSTSWNATMAFGIISILPVVIIFIFMQRYIVSGLTNGAVKA
jgi:multiple sugar transport system permease protein